jgi:hypothetical protein
VLGHDDWSLGFAGVYWKCKLPLNVQEQSNPSLTSIFPLLCRTLVLILRLSGIWERSANKLSGYCGEAF